MLNDPLFDVAARMEQRRSFLVQNAENASRNAQVFANFSSTGVGEHLFPNVVAFGLGFYSKPSVSYGMACSGPPTAGQFPKSYGGVYEWNINAKGFYIGAFCFVVVDVSGLQLDHSFTFQGTAIKMISPGLI